jgi:hypothetical protein
MLHLLLCLTVPLGVDIESRGLTLDKAVRLLEPTAQVAPAISNEVVALRLKGVERAAALERLAQAVNATWTKDDQGRLRLSRTDRQHQQDESRELELRLHQAQVALQAKADLATRQKPFDEAEAQAFLVRYSQVLGQEPDRFSLRFERQLTEALATLPINRAMHELLGTLSPNDLATMDPLLRHVWSTNPNASQRRFSRESRTVLERLNRELAVWQEVSLRGQLRHPRVPVGIGTGISALHTLGGTPSRAMLAVWTEPNLRWVWHASLKLLDPSGRIIGETGTRLDAGPETTEAMSIGADWQDGPNEPLIQPNKETLHLLERRRRQAPRELLEKLIRPEEHEPLALTAGYALLQLAQIRRANMIAVIPDNALLAGFRGAEPVPLRRFEAMIAPIYGRMEVVDGWMLLRTTLPVTDGLARMDRQELGKYLRSIEEPRPKTIEERASLALMLPRADLVHLPATLAYSVAPSGVPDDLSQPRIVQQLKLYGSLSPAQRRSALNEGLAFTSLTPSQIALIRPLVFGPEVWLQAPAADGASAFAQEEPTLILPNGLPRDGTITLMEKGHEGYALWLRDFPGTFGVMSPNQIAMERFMQSRPDLFPDRETAPRALDQFVPARSRTLTLRLNLPRPIYADAWFSDQRLANDAALGYEELPEAFRAAVDAEMKRLYERYKG